MNPTVVALALAFQSTKPLLSDKVSGSQWARDVLAAIRALRSKSLGFDAQQFLALTGYTEEHLRAWGVGIA